MAGFEGVAYEEKRERIPSFLIYITSFLTDIEALGSDRHTQTDIQSES
jgi:hypothetical protein